MTLAKLLEEVPATASKLRSERKNTAAHRRELLASIRRVVKACDKRKDNATNNFVMLEKFYADRRKGTVEAHMVELSDLRE